MRTNLLLLYHHFFQSRPKTLGQAVVQELKDCDRELFLLDLEHLAMLAMLEDHEARREKYTKRRQRLTEKLQHITNESSK